MEPEQRTENDPGAVKGSGVTLASLNPPGSRYQEDVSDQKGLSATADLVSMSQTPRRLNARGNGGTGMIQAEQTAGVEP